MQTFIIFKLLSGDQTEGETLCFFLLVVFSCESELYGVLAGLRFVWAKQMENKKLKNM